MRNEDTHPDSATDGQPRDARRYCESRTCSLPECRKRRLAARKSGWRGTLAGKSQLAHGEFGPWLAENFDASPRSANVYMQIARRWEALEIKSAAPLRISSVREALELITEPREFRVSIPELSDDCEYLAIDPDDTTYAVEVYPHPGAQGYFHVLVWRGMDEYLADSELVFDERGIRYTRELLAHALANLHGVTPTHWTSRPATGATPWKEELETVGA